MSPSVTGNGPTLLPLDMCALEDRVLFSASPVPLIVADVTDSVESFEFEGVEGSLSSVDARLDGHTSIPFEVDSERDVSLVELNAYPDRSAESMRHELFVIDASVPDFDLLMADLRNGRTLAEDTRIEVLVLDRQTDGIRAITDALHSHSSWDAIHIVSHGDPGRVQLGSDVLSAESLVTHLGQLASWNDVLSEDADLMIYGCDVAGGEFGEQFIDALHEITGADVAASDNLTGSAEQGGDWVFEYSVGAIESAIGFSLEARASWENVLSTVNVTQTSDAVNGDVSSVASLISDDGGDGISLREAVLATNADSGVADIINISAGTFTLTLGGILEDLAATGDLDITDDVSIVGAGVGLTVIDGNGIDRVLHVLSGSVTISDVTIQGGDSGVRSGGGLRVSSGTVSVSNVEFTGNNAGNNAGATRNGGGIWNDGVISLTDVVIDNNTSSSGGGGLFNSGTAVLSGVTISNNNAIAGNGGGIENIGGGDLTATNVTISGNQAGNRGGGIENFSTMTLQNVTITENTGIDGSGIDVRTGHATANIRNTIVAGNLGDADVDGTFMSLGNNLIGDVGTSSGWIASDLLNTAVSLGALTDNGGPTHTHALLTGSRGINEGSPIGAPATDQRGIARDIVADIGAYEYDSSSNVNAPVITTATLSADENQINAGVVAGTDPDIPADTLSWSITGNGADDSRFSIDATTGILTFGTIPDFETPADANLDGIYEIEIRLSDGLHQTTKLITIAVNDVNEAPSVALTNLVGSLAEDTDTSTAVRIADIVVTDDALGVNNLTLSGTDAANFEIVGSELRLRAGTNLDFETKPSWDVTVEVDDVAVGGTPDDAASHTLSVTDVNEAPVANDDVGITDENTTYSATLGVNDLLLNDSDVDGDTLTVSTVPLSGPANGLLVLNGDGTFIYTPNANYAGTDSFVYEVSDGNGGTASATVTITINPVNVAPESNPDSFTSTIGQPINGNVLTNDIDTDQDLLTAIVATQPTHGTLTMNADGSFHYLPDPGFVGVDQFSYTAFDGVASSNAAIVEIQIAFAFASDSNEPTTTDPDETPTDDSNDQEKDDVPLTLMVPPLPTGEKNDAAPTGDGVRVRIKGRIVDTQEKNIDTDETPEALPGDYVTYDAATTSLTERVVKAVQHSLEAAKSPQPVHVTGWFWEQMTEVAEQLDENSRTATLGQTVLQGSAAALSVGYVIWSVRSSYLVASLLSALPAWRRFDPLPILDFAAARRRDRQRFQDNEGTLVEMILGEQFPS